MRQTLFLVIALAACGDDGNHGRLADAPPSDVASPRGVTVTVTLGGKPAQGQTVYFQGGGVTDTRTTNADGDASAMVEAGGSVTVIEPEAPQVPEALGPRIHLSTYTAVQPGDHLYLDVPLFEPPAGIAVTVTVPNEGRGRDYYLQTSCGSGYIGRGAAPPPPSATGPTLSARITLAACSGPQDVLVVSRDEANAVRSWAYQPDVTLADGGALAIDALSPSTSLAFRYRNPVGGITGVEVTRQVRTARGELSSSGSFAGVDAAGGYKVELPDLVSPAMTAVTISRVQPRDGFGQQSVLTWGPSAEGVDLDLTAIQLHPYTGIPAFDVGAQAITWTAGAAGAAPDFAIGVVRGVRSAGGGHDWTWRVIAPAAEPRLVFPTLPTTDFDFAFAAGDAPVIDSLTTVQSSAGGYDGARARVFASDLSALATTAAGQVVTEDLFFAPVPQIRKPARRR
jgi:hypothetical protein